MMADFIEHKYQVSDTMTKIYQDEPDDEFIKRQKIIEDANKLVSGKYCMITWELVG